MTSAELQADVLRVLRNKAKPCNGRDLPGKPLALAAALDILERRGIIKAGPNIPHQTWVLA